MGKVGYLKGRMRRFIQNFGLLYGIKVAISKGIFLTFGKLMIYILKSTINKSSDKRIVMESRPDFADNGYALFHYMIEHNYNKKYKIVWLVEDPRDFKDKKYHHVKFVKKMGLYHRHRTVSAIYYSLRSKYVVFTHAWRWVQKQTKNQIYINLWHGCGYKSTREGESGTNIFDYCLVPGEVFVETKSEFFVCPKEKILALGYPRFNFFKNDSPKVLQYLSSLNKDSKKNILWMPTFRDTNDLIYYDNPIPAIIGIPLLNSVLDFKRLNDICKKAKVNLIIKWHRNAGAFGGENESETNVFFLDDKKLKEYGIVLYELLPKTDALITDFSSVAIDYLLLDKPLGFTMDDYEDYKRTRGFVFKDPKKYMPGHHIFDLDELYEFFNDIVAEKDLYADNRYEIMDETHNQTDDYCLRILNHFGIVL